MRGEDVGGMYLRTFLPSEASGLLYPDQWETTHLAISRAYPTAQGRNRSCSSEKVLPSREGSRCGTMEIPASSPGSTLSPNVKRKIRG